MSSIISIISLLFLITYSYSIPIQSTIETSTITEYEYEFTTGETIIDNENRITMQLVSDDESTNTPDIHHIRINDENDSDETKSSNENENKDSDEEKSHLLHPIDSFLYTSSPMTSLIHDFSIPKDTKESFERRTIRPDNKKSEDKVEITSGTRGLFEDIIETVTKLPTLLTPESIAKVSGLLNDKSNEKFDILSVPKAVMSKVSSLPGINNIKPINDVFSQISKAMSQDDSTTVPEETTVHN